MKQSRLKFRQIFTQIHSQLLQIEKGNGQDKPSHDKYIDRSSIRQNSLKTYRQESKQMSARDKQYRASNFYAKCHKSDKINRFFSFLEKFGGEVKKFTETKTEIQNIRISIEFQKLRYSINAVKKIKDAQIIEKMFEEEQQKIDKKFEYRLSYIIFYLIYAKFLQVSCEDADNRLKALTLCEYYSRDLQLYTCTIYCCLEMQKVFCARKYYSTSRHYARKCIKLAVFTKDKNSQFEAIEFIKLLDYYTGTIQGDKNQDLTDQERKLIIDYYNPREDRSSLNFVDQINIHENTRSHNLGHDRQNFEFQVRPEEEIYKVNDNVKQFLTQFSLIKRNLSNFSQKILETVKNTRNIGVIKKYAENCNMIVLQPKTANIMPYNQSQVYLTHRKTEISSKKPTETQFKAFIEVILPQIQKKLINNYKNTKIVAKSNRFTRRMGRNLIS